MTSVAIMQPTYLPWCGYFGLMDSVDIFILLETVQFSRRSWQQRNQIKSSQGAQMLTVPVLSKGKRDQLICEVKLDKAVGFERSHQKAIQMNYSKSPFYEKYSDEIFQIMNDDDDLLSDLTIKIILNIKDRLGIDTKIIRSSELKCCGVKSDLLASLCEQVGASKYISPPGSKIYLDESEAFKKIDVGIDYFSFKHPTYKQQYSGFIENMSTVDMLFNCGESSLSLIKDGVKRVL